jgi:uncharacterized membrane protein YphA (DoxX/SURF4 family)
MPALDAMTWLSLIFSFAACVLWVVSSRRPAPEAAPAWFKDPVNLTTLVARVALGGVLVWAGASKVPDLATSVQVVKQYQIVPYALLDFVGYALPIGELLLGVVLLMGAFTRWTAALGGLLMAVYVVAIISLWARGIWMDCGCSGTEGTVLAKATAIPKYVVDIIRDILLASCGVRLFLDPKSTPSVDRWLTPPTTEAAPLPPKSQKNLPLKSQK